MINNICKDEGSVTKSSLNHKNAAKLLQSAPHHDSVHEPKTNKVDSFNSNRPNRLLAFCSPWHNFALTSVHL